MMRIRVAILALLLAAAGPSLRATAFASHALTRKTRALMQLIARAETARPEDRPALYLEIARQKADVGRSSPIDDGNAEAGNAALQRSRDYSQEGHGRVH